MRNRKNPISEMLLQLSYPSLLVFARNWEIHLEIQLELIAFSQRIRPGPEFTHGGRGTKTGAERPGEICYSIRREIQLHERGGDPETLVLFHLFPENSGTPVFVRRIARQNHPMSLSSLLAVQIVGEM